MLDATAKNLAHELTIEYIKANQSILHGNSNEISEMVKNIANVSLSFYKAIKDNDVLNKLY